MVKYTRTEHHTIASRRIYGCKSLIWIFVRMGKWLGTVRSSRRDISDRTDEFDWTILFWQVQRQRAETAVRSTFVRHCRTREAVRILPKPTLASQVSDRRAGLGSPAAARDRTRARVFRNPPRPDDDDVSFTPPNGAPGDRRRTRAPIAAVDGSREPAAHPAREWRIAGRGRASFAGDAGALSRARRPAARNPDAHPGVETRFPMVDDDRR